VTKLTSDNVRTLPLRGSDALYPDIDKTKGVPGLYLRIREGGSRTFVIQWRDGARQRRETVGKVGVLSLDEARKKARKMLVGIDDGNDPATIKAKSKREGSNLFLPLADDYLERRAQDMKLASLDQIRRHLRDYWKPLHRHAVSKIDRATVASELRTIIKDRGPIAADRARSTLSAFYAWLIGEGLAETNPVIGTNKSGQARDRERVLTDAELVAIWNASDPETDYGRIVRLLMLTGQRRDEIADLQSCEIAGLDDSGRAQIGLPASRTKNGRPHDVPLSAPAVAILRATPVRDGRSHLFGEGSGGYSGFSRAKERLDERSGVTDWTQHDMRRTMATRMGDLGVEPHIIEAVLNHVSGHKAGVAGVYNRATYATQKRAALDTWAGYLQTMLARAEGANIISLRS
jgi:integrase